MVAAEGKSFAEILGDLKGGVDPKQMYVNIREISSHRKKEVVVTVDGGQECANKLEE